jgi:hypothetical protein
MFPRNAYLEVAYDDRGQILRVVLPDGTEVTKPDSYDAGYETPLLKIQGLEAYSLLYFRRAGDSEGTSVALLGARLADSLSRQPEIRPGESVVIAFDDHARVAGVTLGGGVTGPLVTEVGELTGVDILNAVSAAVFYSEYKILALLKKHRCVGGGGHSYW